MQSTCTILKRLNELLQNKEAYSIEEYEKELLHLMHDIDDMLLMESYEKTNSEEQEHILQQFKALLKIE